MGDKCHDVEKMDKQGSKSFPEPVQDDEEEEERKEAIMPLTTHNLFSAVYKLNTMCDILLPFSQTKICFLITGISQSTL